MWHTVCLLWSAAAYARLGKIIHSRRNIQRNSIPHNLVVVFFWLDGVVCPFWMSAWASALLLWEFASKRRTEIFLCSKCSWLQHSHLVAWHSVHEALALNKKRYGIVCLLLAAIKALCRIYDNNEVKAHIERVFVRRTILILWCRRTVFCWFLLFCASQPVEEGATFPLALPDKNCIETRIFYP